MSRKSGNKNSTTPGKMYYVRPAFELPEPFPEIPTRMYKIKPVVPTPMINGTTDEPAIDDNGKFRLQDSRTSTCNFQNIPEARVQEIEARQQVMLDKLANLKNMIQSIHSKYVSESAQNTRRDLSEEDGHERMDIVVNADPKKPPYSLLFLHKALAETHGPIRFQAHIHSSMTETPEKYLKIFDELEEDIPSDVQEKISIKLIWKNMDHGVDLMVDPYSQTPIRGEANVIRFLSRLLSNQSSLNYDSLDWATLVKVDGLLELATEPDPLNLALVERQLTSQQRYGPFLLDEVSIADFVLFSALAHQCTSNPNKFNNSPSILRWLKDCQKFGDFELFLFY